MNNKSRFIDAIYRWLPVIPIAILLVMFAAAGWSWQRQERRLQTESAKLFAIPVDRSSSQYTDRWQSILRSSERLSGTYQRLSIAIDMNPNGQWVVPPSDPFILEPIVDQYTQDAGPILIAMKSLVESDQEIWIPSAYDADGINFAAIGKTRNVARLLAMEFVSAFHDGQNDRAIFAIKSLERFYGKPNQPRPMVAEMVRQACLAMGLTLVRQSMQYDQWSDAEIEHLEAFVDRIGPLEVIWSITLQGEMQFMWNAADQGVFGPGSMARRSMTMAPSMEVRLLEQYEAIQSKPGQVGTVEFGQSLARLEENSTANLSSIDVWLNVPTMSNAWSAVLYLNPFDSFAQTISRHQATIRLTKTSIAVRKYHRAKGQWPDSLSDLSAVGLPLSETLDPAGNPMEVNVTRDGDFQIKFNDYPENTPEYYSVQYLDTIVMRSER